MKFPGEEKNESGPDSHAYSYDTIETGGVFVGDSVGIALETEGILQK